MSNPEKAEEAKLKARYPNLGNKPGGSDLLRKRLQKGVSYLLCNPAKTCRFHSSRAFEPTALSHFYLIHSLALLFFYRI